MKRSPATVYQLVCLMMLLLGTTPSSAQQTGTVIRIAVRLQKPATHYQLKVAPLRYDKTFAFSFTLDDGLASAYRVALPYLGGGEVSAPYRDPWGYDQGGDGKHYPGLYFTDGCGNNIPFTASVALNAEKITADDNRGHRGFLSWSQVAALDEAGWGILNHGYRHLTGAGFHPYDEVAENDSAVARHLGLEMRHFVIPGGRDDRKSDQPYTEAAFSAGMQTVQCEHFPGHILVIDSGTALRQLKLGRAFLYSVPASRSDPSRALLEEIADSLRDGSVFWVNAFTHGTGNDNIWNISLPFPAFKDFFGRLEGRYGAQGSDVMWVAPVGAVYDYLLISRSVRCQLSQRGRRLIAVIHTARLPETLQHRALSLVLTSEEPVKKIRVRHGTLESYHTATTTTLINLGW